MISPRQATIIRTSSSSKLRLRRKGCFSRTAARTAPSTARDSTKSCSRVGAGSGNELGEQCHRLYADALRQDCLHHGFAGPLPAAEGVDAHSHHGAYTPLDGGIDFALQGTFDLCQGGFEFPARSPREVWMYLFAPPGWRPDGEELTAAKLKKRTGLVAPPPAQPAMT